MPSRWAEITQFSDFETKIINKPHACFTCDQLISVRAIQNAAVVGHIARSSFAISLPFKTDVFKSFTVTQHYSVTTVGVREITRVVGWEGVESFGGDLPGEGAAVHRLAQDGETKSCCRL